MGPHSKKYTATISAIYTVLNSTLILPIQINPFNLTAGKNTTFLKNGTINYTTPLLKQDTTNLPLIYSIFLTLFPTGTTLIPSLQKYSIILSTLMTITKKVLLLPKLFILPGVILFIFTQMVP